MTMATNTVTAFDRKVPTGALDERALLSVVPPPPAGDPWTQSARELEDIAQLGPDWDGEGAAAPRRASLEAAAVLMQRLRNEGQPAPSRISATPLGAIVAAWHLAADHLVEIEILNSRHAEYLEMHGKQAIQYDFSIE